jgi:hypothetical protein
MTSDLKNYDKFLEEIQDNSLAHRETNWFVFIYKNNTIITVYM